MKIQKPLGYIVLVVAIVLVYLDTIFLGLVLAVCAAGILGSDADHSWFDSWGGDGGE